MSESEPTQPPSQANTFQIGGTHYASSYQHWDLVANNKLDYFQGVITKYVTRWRKKDGVRDLSKAIHYIEKYVELGGCTSRGFSEFGLQMPSDVAVHADILRFCEINGVPEGPERAVMQLVADGRRPELVEAAKLLAKIAKSHGVAEGN